MFVWPRLSAGITASVGTSGKEDRRKEVEKLHIKGS